MSFVQGVDYLSDTEECRRLARNVVVGDFTDDQIIPWQVYNYSILSSFTGKLDWDISDVQYYALKGIETELVAADLEMHYGDGSSASTDAAQSKKAAAMAELKDLITATGLGTGSESAVGGNMVVGQTPYKSWNLNTDAQIPRRGLRVY
jgi:hypothetical protein